MIGEFNPTYSTNNIWVDEEFDYCLTLLLEAMQASIATKVDGNHTHNGYLSQSDLASARQILEDMIATKANANHTHSDYAEVNHEHSEYVTQLALDALSAIINGKADATHSHTEYAEVEHTHSDYASTSHSHTEYAPISHIHDYSPSSHTHTGVYEASGAAANALTSANAYTDSKINLLVGEGASTTLDTIGEISSAIEDNQDAIDLLNAAIANKANVSHNHTIANVSGLQSALDGKSATSHTHNYAASSSAGGAATSANKLNTNAGSATQPVYFANGIPVKTTYTLGASVPSGAKFTDTTYSAVTTSANGLMLAADKVKLDGMVLATVSEVETYLGI